MVLLFGAAPDTGNQGVTALCHSAVDGLARHGVSGITVADHGRGLRKESWRLGDATYLVQRVGITHHRRIWRGDCLRSVRVLSRLGALGNSAASAVLGARAVLDVSGGDSFTDIYGEKRFQAMCLTKRLALDAGRPLILLPQTLGPFHDAERRGEASEIMRSAAAIWVRDAASHEMLKEMLGEDFDPARHHAGLDMALLLPSRKATAPAPISDWLSDQASTPVAGLNVSGLLCCSAAKARADFGLKSDHRHVVEAAARAVLGASDGFRLVLVSHVMRHPTDPESDWAAARTLEEKLAVEFPGRIATLPQGYDASELKGLIGQLSWFSGARMHATIAAFSSGVPTLGLGYSDKAGGVFSACGLDGHVADLRRLDADAVGSAVEASVAARATLATTLRRMLPALLARAEDQMNQIGATIRSLQPAVAA